MPRFVALLRGVNVGKAQRLPMAEWRALLAALGYTDVQTLLNSGNAVFASPDRSAAQHAARIRGAIAERLGMDVPVIVKSAAQMAAIESGNALRACADDPSRLLVAFAADAGALGPLAATLSAQVVPPERLHAGPHALYLWCANGILQSPAAAALLGRHGRAATTRNGATVSKILRLLRENEA